MPFGSDPFRDQLIREMVGIEEALSHQCLSAVIPFGTPLVSPERVPRSRHQCLSAVIPFGTFSLCVELTF